MNLAEQIKNELTDRAKNTEICKKYFLDWVMEEFRKGENPVRIYCKNNFCTGIPVDIKKRFDLEGKRPHLFQLDYKDGKMYAMYSYGKEMLGEMTDLPSAQLYAPNKICECDKMMFLASEGFKCYKHWVYGEGDVIDITF